VWTGADNTYKQAAGPCAWRWEAMFLIEKPEKYKLLDRASKYVQTGSMGRNVFDGKL
jgi:hypothetical protein